MPMSILRQEKGTPNSNAFRVMTTGVILAVMLLLGVDPLFKLWDDHLRARPWVKAEIEIVPGRYDDSPRIIYEVKAKHFVTGSWTAWVQTEDEVRFCNSQGSASYGPENISRVWSWDAFFERTDCSIPTIPFSICASYSVRTARNVPGEFGPYCSLPYDPRIVKALNQ